MNCKQCVKINPIPSCLTGYGTMELSNITFPDYSGEEMTVAITDTATGLTQYIEAVADELIDLTDLYPLMGHYYEIKFLVGGVQVSFIITNPDGTFAEGCCIEFIPDGRNWTGAEYEISTTQCVVE